MSGTVLIVNPARLVVGPQARIRPFPNIEFGERDVFSINAAGNLGQGEEIATASWACGVYSGGVDLNASNYVGTSSVSGSIMSVLAGIFQPNIKYALEVTFTTNVSGVIRKLWSIVLCVPAAVASSPPPPPPPPVGSNGMLDLSNAALSGSNLVFGII